MPFDTSHPDPVPILIEAILALTLTSEKASALGAGAIQGITPAVGDYILGLPSEGEYGLRKVTSVEDSFNDTANTSEADTEAELTAGIIVKVLFGDSAGHYFRPDPSDLNPATSEWEDLGTTPPAAIALAAAFTTVEPTGVEIAAS